MNWLGVDALWAACNGFGTAFFVLSRQQCVASKHFFLPFYIRALVKRVHGLLFGVCFLPFFSQ